MGLLMMSDEESEVLDRVRNRIRDLIFDHSLDLEEQLKGAQLCGDPLGIIPMLSKDIEEVRAVLDRSGYGIFELLRVWMDLIDEMGI